MKGITSLLLCLLVAAGSHAFTTKKPTSKNKQHRTAVFTPVAEPDVKKSTATTTTTTTKAKATTANAFVSSSVQDHHFEIRNEEPLVSPGTAAIACLLTIAVGFGLGYGT